MGRLIFSAIASIDGYTVDSSGSFDWARPDPEVHSFVNDLERDVGTYLYGRRMYETMKVWQDMPGAGGDPVTADYAQVWQSADKVVYSSTLAEVATPRTRLEERFDPETVQQLVADAPGRVSVGGPTLAARAFAAGLVDEVLLILVPVAVGGGTPALPKDRFLRLDLQEARRFAGGTVALHYTVERS